jgi:hypothetical protein
MKLSLEEVKKLVREAYEEGYEDGLSGDHKEFDFEGNGEVIGYAKTRLAELQKSVDEGGGE